MRVKENFKLKPNHFYGYSKYMGEKMIQDYSKINKFNYTILRFFNIYDQIRCCNIHFLAQKFNRLITIFGNGNQKEILYVDDLCGAIAKVLKNNNSNNKIYNLGSGKALSINEIFKRLNYNSIILIKETMILKFQYLI